MQELNGIHRNDYRERKSHQGALPAPRSSRALVRARYSLHHRRIEGLYKECRRVFCEYAAVHCCQWYKRENVTNYLSENDNPNKRDVFNSAMKRRRSRSLTCPVRFCTSIEAQRTCSLKAGMSCIVLSPSRNSARSVRRRTGSRAETARPARIRTRSSTGCTPICVSAGRDGHPGDG